MSLYESQLGSFIVLILYLQLQYDLLKELQISSCWTNKIQSSISKTSRGLVIISFMLRSKSPGPGCSKAD